MRKDDYQIILMNSGESPFAVYQWDGNAFRYKRGMATEAEVQAFVDANELRYISSGTHGTWPTRKYRPKRAKRASLLARK